MLPHEALPPATRCTYTETVSVEADLMETRYCHCLAARRSARVITRMFDEKLRPHGLRSTQFSVLAALSLKGETPLGELAEVLGLERTTLSRSASVLEQNSWIASVQSSDGRERRLKITRSGRAKLEGALSDWQEVQAKVGEWLAKGNLENSIN